MTEICNQSWLDSDWMASSIIYLAGVSSTQVQHVKKEPQLTGQAELLLAQVILYQAPDWLQEVQYLSRHTQG